MKKLTILLEFYRKNIAAVLLLLAFMSVSLFYMVEFLGYLGYQTYSLSMMKRLDLAGDGVYFMSADGFDSWLNDQTPTYDDFVAQNFSAVKDIVNPAHSYVGYQDLAVNLVICDQQFIDRFSFADRGAWFTRDESDPSHPIEVVVGGCDFADVAVGADTTLSIHDFDGTFLREEPVKVIGKDVEPTMDFSFGYRANRVAADKIFDNTNNLIYITRAGLVRLYGSDISTRSNNFLITFREEASQAEKEEVLDYLSQRGQYQTFSEIRDTSREEISARLRTDLPRPLFMLCVSTFAMIAVSVLLTNKQMEDYRIYYLTGCSRRRSFLYTLAAILGIGGVAGGVNLVYLAWLNRFFTLVKNADSVKYHNYLVMNNSALYIVLFIVISALLSVLVPFAMLRKHSAMEVYRRPS